MSYRVFRALVILFVALVVGAVALWLMTRPSRVSSRFGMRGLKRQQALMRGGIFPAIDPLVRWMAKRVGGTVSPELLQKIDRELTLAGDFLGLVPEEYVALTVMTAAGGALLGAVVSVFVEQAGWMPIPVTTLVGAFVPFVVVDAAKAERAKMLNRGLPDVIDLISLSMSAGMDFPASVRQVVETSKANEAIRDELQLVLHHLELGHTRSQALRVMMDRSASENVREFAQTVIQSEERGNPVVEVLETYAGVARGKRTTLAENRANDMLTKMVAPSLVITSIPVYIVMIGSGLLVETISQGFFK